MTTLRTIKMTSDTILLETLGRALHTLVEKDGFLLQNATNERAISFRLAMHLQALFPDWDVDCEYNCWETPCRPMRHMITPTDAAATEARTIYPDIAIHRRGTAENLAAIEIAKSTSRFGKHQDIKKLKAYQQQMGYRHAVLLTVGVGDDIDDNRVEIMP